MEGPEGNTSIRRKINRETKDRRDCLVLTHQTGGGHATPRTGCLRIRHEGQRGRRHRAFFSFQRDAGAWLAGPAVVGWLGGGRIENRRRATGRVQRWFPQ